MIKDYEKYLGIPYELGGKDPSTALDCSGFIANLLDVPIMTAHDYYQLSYPVSSPTPDTLVFFKKADALRVHHLGYMINDKEFVHASSSKGVIVTKLDNSYWLPLIYRYGKLTLKKYGDTTILNDRDSNSTNSADNSHTGTPLTYNPDGSTETPADWISDQVSKLVRKEVP